MEEQQNFFGCKVTYFGSDKKRFQLDIPEHKTHKVTSEYKLEGTKKGSKPSKRYSTDVTRVTINFLSYIRIMKAFLGATSRHVESGK